MGAAKYSVAATNYALSMTALDERSRESSAPLVDPSQAICVHVTISK